MNQHSLLKWWISNPCKNDESQQLHTSTHIFDECNLVATCVSFYSCIFIVKSYNCTYITCLSVIYMWFQGYNNCGYVPHPVGKAFSNNILFVSSVTYHGDIP